MEQARPVGDAKELLQRLDDGGTCEADRVAINTAEICQLVEIHRSFEGALRP